MENDKLISDLLRMSEMNSMSLWKRAVCKRAADALSIPAEEAHNEPTTKRSHMDLIRRIDVIDAIRGEREYLIAHKQLGAEHVLARHADAVIDSIPAVDAVPMDYHDRCMQIEIQKRMEVERNRPEVVRCRECVHFEPFRQHDGFCKIDDLLHDNDFFCKNGEHREDGDA